MSSLQKWCVVSCVLVSMAAAQIQKPAHRLEAQPAAARQMKAMQQTLTAQQERIDKLESEVRQLTEGNRQFQADLQQAQKTADQAATLNLQTQTTATVTQKIASRAELSAADAKNEIIQQKQSLEKELKTATLQSGWNGEHFFLRTADKKFDIEPFGYLQLDYRGYDGAATPTDTFAIRRGRFGFLGKLSQHYEFTLLADFADRNSALLREGSLNVNYIPRAQFKFGQFKEPFSQEELQGAPYIDFVERSLVNNLAPAYSPGLQLHGQLLNGAIQYQAGAFNGKSFLNLDDTSTPEGVVRLRFYPWRNTGNTWLKSLALGGAGTDGRTSNGVSFSGITPTRTFTFFRAEPVNGQVVRANGELTWLKGPAAIRAEYDQSNQDRQGVPVLLSVLSRRNLSGVVAKGYYASGTYLLTGENRPESGQPVPRFSFFDTDHHGWGAWELAFRYSELQMEDGTQRSRADQFTAGVNWYPTAFVRYMLDFNVERLRNRTGSPIPFPLVFSSGIPALTPQDFFSVQTRVQFRF